MKIFKMIRGFFLKRSRSYKIRQNVIFHVKHWSLTLIVEPAPGYLWDIFIRTGNTTLLFYGGVTVKWDHLASPCINYMQYLWGYALPVRICITRESYHQYPWVISSVPVRVCNTRESYPQYPWGCAVPVRICITREGSFIHSSFM